MPDREQVTKSYDFQPTRFGLDGIVEGFASVFGNVDLDGDVVEKGSFTKSLSDRPVTSIPMALDHTRGIGVTTHLEEVSRDDLPNVIKGRYPDATGGLFGRGQVVLMGDGLDWAHEEQRRIRAGKPSGMSFVAGIVRATKSRGYRALQELAIDEWGPQSSRNIAINPGAMVTSMKGAERDVLTPFADADLGEEWIEFIAKAGRMFSAKNLSEMKAAYTTLGRLIKLAEGEGSADEPAPDDTEKARPRVPNVERERLDLLRMTLMEA